MQHLTLPPVRADHVFNPEADGYIYFPDRLHRYDPNLIESHVLCTGCGNWFCDFTMQYYANQTAAMRYTATEPSKPYCNDCAMEIIRADEARSGDKILKPIEINVPALYLDANEIDFVPKIRKKIESWPYTTPLLMLMGIPGAGKTRATWAAAKRMAFKGRRVWTTTCGDVKGMWLKHVSTNSLLREKLENDLINVPWLILDDLSAVKPTQGWAEFFHMLIDKRTINQRPTLITTSCEGTKIEEFYGEQIRSRLNLFDNVLMPKKDWRREGKKKETEPELIKGATVGGKNS